MSRTRVKICGVQSVTDLEVAAAAGADAVGLLSGVSVESPREITAETAGELAAATPPFLTSVLVTMADSAGSASNRIATVDPDIVQVHGDVSVADLAAIGAERPVIYATDPDDDDGITAAASVVDGVLLDTPTADGTGGTGRTHDWAASKAWVERLEVPVMLAGGLTPTNVAAAVETVDPYAVDVASGVDGDTGKDPGAVRDFVQAVNGAGGDP